MHLRMIPKPIGKWNIAFSMEQSEKMGRPELQNAVIFIISNLLAAGTQTRGFVSSHPDHSADEAGWPATVRWRD